jgi:hypothetical protein
MTDTAANIIMGRKEHAARINEAWQKTVDGIIETGLRIHDARTGQHALPHGTFQEMVRDDLHFTPRTAQRLMAIASNKVLSNATHVSHLPASWGTLYELSVIGDRGYDLEAGIESGAIHPKLERKEVKALLPTPQRDDDLEEAEPDPEDEAGAEDDDQTIWRRGLMHRAQEAISGAAFEDWSQFEADERLAKTVEKAANQWCLLSHHLWVMHNRDTVDAEPTNGGDAPSKKRGRPKGSKNKPKPVEEPITATAPTATVDAEAAAEERKALYVATEPTTAVVNDQEPAVTVPADDPGPIPEFLRRTA